MIPLIFIYESATVQNSLCADGWATSLKQNEMHIVILL